MKKTIYISLSSQVPAQKNNKRIVYSRKTGKPFPVTDTKTKRWQNHVHEELLQAKQAIIDSGVPLPFPGRVGVRYTFRVVNNIRRDLDNMEASVNDSLTKSGILSDDAWQFRYTIGSDAYISRNNPGVNLAIVYDDEDVMLKS